MTQEELDSREPSSIILLEDKYPDQCDRCTDQVNQQNWICSRNVKILIVGLCSFIVVLIITVIVLGVEVSKDRGQSNTHKLTPCVPCPRCWILYEGTCYYVSKSESNGTSSLDFCSSHNASLIRITHENKDIVMLLKGKRSIWIGLKKDPKTQRWKWINEENSTLEVVGSGGNCAYMNDDGKASSSRCTSVHHWICHKPRA